MKILVVVCVGLVAMLPGTVVGGQATGKSEYPALAPGYPSPDSPWTGSKKAPKTDTKTVAPAPAVKEAAAVAPAATTDIDLGVVAPPKQRKHQVSASGDYFLGQGNVTMPFGFSLREVPGLGQNIQPNVAKPDRTSDYLGATISYSYLQTWFLDIGYAHGSSSGKTDVTLGADPGLNPALPSSFEITDDWFQAYVRYTFPGLTGKRLSAYLRAGASWVQADLTDQTVFPALGLYHQTDKTEDLLGNLGFGVAYSIYSSPKIRILLQVEGEGFYGTRSQETLEVLTEAGPGFVFPTVSIDNNVYGGIGRGTVRFEYRFSSAFNVFLDGGIQGKYLQIDYSGLGGFDELLWGPYAKVGLRYSF